MVEITGSLTETITDNGSINDTWRIPALGERLARQKVKTNTRIKGRTGTEIVSVDQIAQGDLPGQKIFRVQTRSPR